MHKFYIKTVNFDNKRFDNIQQIIYNVLYSYILYITILNYALTGD